MPRSATQFEIHLPLFFNDGSAVPAEYLHDVETELLKRFGGLKSVRADNWLRGLWRHADQTYEDQVVVITCIASEDPQSAIRFYEEYKETLKERFRQMEVLITAQQIQVI